MSNSVLAGSTLKINPAYLCRPKFFTLKNTKPLGTTFADYLAGRLYILTNGTENVVLG